MTEDSLSRIERRLDSIGSKMDTLVTRDEFQTAMETMVTRDDFNTTMDAVAARMDTMVTRDEFQAAMATMVTRDEYLTSMDELLTIVRRLDQERIFTLEWVKRIESDVERIKKHLHLT